MPNLSLNGDCDLYYELIEGDPDRPCLVFLHEGLGCTTLWRDFPKSLCRATQCPGLVYDRLGYGRSSAMRRRRTIHYLHDYALRELPEVLGRLIPDSHYILIGHSDGGSIAFVHAAERPLRLKGLVTEAAHVFVEPRTITGIREADSAWREGRLRGLSIHHGIKAEDVFRSWSETWLADWFEPWCIEYLLPSVDVPVLAIQGVHDRYGSERQVESIITNSSGPARSAMIEDCGHIPHHESRAAVLDLMRGWVEELSGGANAPTTHY